MESINENKFPSLTVEITVKITVSCIDRGNVYTNNLLSIILSITDGGFYKIETKKWNFVIILCRKPDISV
jgi:hypothetical protein